MPVLYSKVKVLGHPLHPMLVAFPVTLYAVTLVSFIVYGASGRPFWFAVGTYANIAAVIMAAVAAVPGFIDWAMGIPNGSKAKSIGAAHMLANVAALAVFTVNAFVQGAALDEIGPPATLAIVLSAIGLGVVLVAGFYGWSLVQTYHSGVDLTPQQMQSEPIERRLMASRGRDADRGRAHPFRPSHTAWRT